MGGRGSGSGRAGGGGGSVSSTTKPALSSIQVSSDYYTYYNGKAPSGQGRWTFKIGDQEYTFNGNYSTAKALAKRKAQSEGQTRVTLRT